MLSYGVQGQRSAEPAIPESFGLRERTVDSGTKSDTKQHRNRECADGRREEEYVYVTLLPVRTGAAESCRM